MEAVKVEAMAEDAALADHWLRCEHSRSAMVEWPAAAVPALSDTQGRRPAPSAGWIHVEENLAGLVLAFRIRPGVRWIRDAEG